VAVRFADVLIDMTHGAGGKASRRLVERLIVPLVGAGEVLGDAAYVDVGGAAVAITTDSFVVRPLAFPGGSIGDLAVNGTVNDLAVSGAIPLALVCSLIVEAGTPAATLEREMRAMGNAARSAGVAIVGGDTKVVEHGKAEELYITTTGIGRLDPRVRLSAASVRPGDRVLLSGHIGDHGITVLLARGDIDLAAEDLRSDTRSVYPLASALIGAAGDGLRWMRDPTRGGLATTLNELARDCGCGLIVEEDAVPVRDAVRGSCELLGLDPLHIANEGQFVAIVSADAADRALGAVRAAGGESAALIGRVEAAPARTVLAIAPYGGTRVVDMLVGDPLPRIC
jgi:hydrogenase expression/formation protein HypE